MKHSLFLLLVAVVFSAAIPPKQHIQESKILFTIKNAGVNVEGSFGPLSGMVNFHPEAIHLAKVDVMLASSTISTGIGARDNHLKQKEYFDSKNFPEIRMTSRFFGKGAEPNSFRGYFTLSMKGTVKDITVPFTWSEEGDIQLIQGSFELNRRDFNIGSSSLILSDEVKVEFQIKLAPSND